MTIKVLGIAPYPGLRDLLTEIAKTDPEIELDVEIADLQEALPVLKRNESEDYDIIISRGGTASVIRLHTEIPVVDVPVSGYDILRVLTLIKDANSKVAIIGFPNICQGAATVSNLLDFEIPIYSIESETEVSVALEKAIQNGAQIILGDRVTVRTAESMGYNGILITSGRESVIEALTDVKRAFDIHRKGQEKARFFEKILKHAQTGILVVGRDHLIQYANPPLLTMLDLELENLQGQLLYEISEDLYEISVDILKNNILSRTDNVRIGDTSFRVLAVPFQESSAQIVFYMDSLPLKDKSRLTAFPSPLRTATFAQIMGSSQAIQLAVTRAKKFVKSDKHIWISGEQGSGRSLFGQAIHSEGENRHLSFYSLSCSATDPVELESILFGTGEYAGLMTTPSTGTVYLADIDRMTFPLQERLAFFLQRNDRIRMIGSSIYTKSQILKRMDFHSDMATLVGQLHLHVPPLRDRVEDFEEIARVIIAAHNSEYGKHIVGIRDEVLEMLADYGWPGNLKEFVNVLDEMLMETNGHYVETRDVAALWEKYLSTNWKTTGINQYHPIDLTGTWEEIEKRILLEVLKEEQMNQSKAAKRLGINRATLWRKLRNMLHN